MIMRTKIKIEKKGMYNVIFPISIATKFVGSNR